MMPPPGRQAAPLSRKLSLDVSGNAEGSVPPPRPDSVQPNNPPKPKNGEQTNESDDSSPPPPRTVAPGKSPRSRAVVRKNSMLLQLNAKQQLRKSKTPVWDRNASIEEPEDTQLEALERASITGALAVYSIHGRVSKKHLLGRGKFSSVFSGCVVMQPSQTSVDLAIKEFSYARKKPPLPVLRVCQQEVEILRSLSHPKVTAFLGAELTPRPQILLELMSLGSLHDVIYGANGAGEYSHSNSFSLATRRWASGDVPFREKLGLAIDVSEGLAYLHSQHMLHGDLKSHNVMVGVRKQRLLNGTSPRHVLVAGPSTGDYDDDDDDDDDGPDVDGDEEDDGDDENDRVDDSGTRSRARRLKRLVGRRRRRLQREACLDWVAKIGDLGSASRVGEACGGSWEETGRLQEVRGTSGWIAPEVLARGANPNDADRNNNGVANAGSGYSLEADVWSFGVLLWECFGEHHWRAVNDEEKEGPSSGNGGAIGGAAFHEPAERELVTIPPVQKNRDDRSHSPGRQRGLSRSRSSRYDVEDSNVGGASLPVLRGDSGRQMSMSSSNPFAGVDTDEYLRRLRGGDRWEMPEPTEEDNASGRLLEGVVRAAEECWSMEPAERPTIRTLRGRLQRLGDAASLLAGACEERSILEDRQKRYFTTASPLLKSSSLPSTPSALSSSASSASSRGSILNELNGARRQNMAYDDWDYFVQASKALCQSRESEASARELLLLVDAAPLRRRKRIEGQIDVEVWYHFQFQRPRAAARFAVAFISDGIEGLQVRENQKRYHPEQSAFALDMQEPTVQQRVKLLRSQLINSGHLDSSKRQLSVQSHLHE